MIKGVEQRVDVYVVTFQPFEWAGPPLTQQQLVEMGILSEELPGPLVEQVERRPGWIEISEVGAFSDRLSYG
jgi:hypothetical protein